MKPVKKSFAVISLVLSLLFLFSFHLNAEGITDPDEIQNLAETTPDPDSEVPTEQTGIQADTENLKETDIESSEAAQSSTMSITGESNPGSAAGGTISSMILPESSIFTGSATTKIPIIVPPGRGGIAPNLALVYNSAKKNGWVGVGWDLDMGAIQRSTKFGLDCTGDGFVVLANGHRSSLLPEQMIGDPIIMAQKLKAHLPNISRSEMMNTDGK